MVNGGKLRDIAITVLLLTALITIPLLHIALPPQEQGREPRPVSPPRNPLEKYSQRLASPPMYVDAWTGYGPDRLYVHKPVLAEACPQPDYFKYDGGWGAWGHQDDPREFFMMVEAPIDINHIKDSRKEPDRAIIYLDRLDSVHLREWEWYDPITGIHYFYFGSIYVPVSLHGEVELSFKYDFEAWIWSERYKGPYTWIMVEYDIFMRAALCVVDALDTPKPRYDYVPKEYIGRGFVVSGVKVDGFHDTYIYNSAGNFTQKVIDVSERSFSVRWNFTGETWVGLRVVIVIGIRTAANGDDRKDLLTRVGWAGANMTGRIWDIQLKCDWRKPAYTIKEAGCADLDNHTAAADDTQVVKHDIEYSLAYSSTWDHFNFTIGAPDYEQYKSPIREGGREGVIIDSCRLHSSDYLRRMVAILYPRTHTVRVYVETFAMGHGNVTLSVYNPELIEVRRLDMQFIGPCCLYASFNYPVSCKMEVRVVDEDGAPAANALVEAWDPYDPTAYASASTDERGVAYLALPHQGLYVLKITYGLKVAFRRCVVIPLLAARFVGPCPVPPARDFGDVELGFIASGHPDGPPYNKVRVKLGTENTLYVDGLIITWPFPFDIERVNASVTVWQDGEPVAELITPGEAYLQNGTYTLTAQDEIIVNGTTYYLVGWLMTDSAFTDQNATINLSMDRHVIAVYGPSSLLEIVGAVEGTYYDLWNVTVMVLGGVRNLPGAFAAPGIALPGGLSAMDFMARLVFYGAGMAPFIMPLPSGTYLLATYENEPENYEFKGWEGVDEELGSLPLDPELLMPSSCCVCWDDQVRYFIDWVYGDCQLTNNMSFALVKLGEERQVTCVYELEEGKRPQLAVDTKLMDGTLLPGIEVIVSSSNDFYYVGETPLVTYVEPGNYTVTVPRTVGGYLEVADWRNVDEVLSMNETHVVFSVSCGEGREVIVFYSYKAPEGGAASASLHPEAWTVDLDIIAIEAVKSEEEP